MEVIPPRWEKLAFPCTRPMTSWLIDLKERGQQLGDWTNDPINIPKVVGLSKLFNLQSTNAARLGPCFLHVFHLQTLINRQSAVSGLMGLAPVALWKENLVCDSNRSR